MTTLITNDRILVTDTNGNVSFDTDNEMFFSTDFLTGSINIGQRSTGQAYLKNYTHNIGPCNPLANRVIGMMNVVISNPSNSDTPSFGWFNVDGTYVHYIDGVGGSGEPYQHEWCARASMYTFYCKGGSVKLSEQIQLLNVSIQGNALFVHRAFTINYRLWCGLFDG